MFLIIIMQIFLQIGGVLINGSYNTTMNNPQVAVHRQYMVVGGVMPAAWEYNFFTITASGDTIPKGTAKIEFLEASQIIRDQPLLVWQAVGLFGQRMWLFENAIGLFESFNSELKHAHKLLPRDLTIGQVWRYGPDSFMLVEQVSIGEFAGESYTLVEVSLSGHPGLAIFQWALGLGLVRHEQQYFGNRDVYELVSVIP